jgi:hypothetical protein
LVLGFGVEECQDGYFVGAMAPFPIRLNRTECLWLLEARRKKYLKTFYT